MRTAAVLGGAGEFPARPLRVRSGVRPARAPLLLSLVVVVPSQYVLFARAELLADLAPPAPLMVEVCPPEPWAFPGAEG
eukprot:9474265-Pyramimonas_sp.AAC.1